jgi:hypothetical protein
MNIRNETPAVYEFVVAAVTVEGISLPGGAMIAVELDQPRHRHAVLAHAPGGDVEIVTMHSTEQEAYAALKVVLSKVAAVERAMAGGTVQ